MPKKRVVASLVGNLSPVKRRTAILVSSVRHLRGDIGDELKSRAGGGGGQYCVYREGEDRAIPSWKTEVRSSLKPEWSASSSFFA